ncbi:glutathione S-transferase T3-like [Raphanus sativus]|uniref:Glutathione S-transferase T3-like n=1 Tax=Raphanus sativus TaxID=3726 RepID=A0A6J0LXU6_RAPSA|nr:glutathione S-transferase T3-like [Raphanus sativus]
MDSTPYAEAASLVELLNSQEDSVFRLVDGSLEPSSSQFPLFGSQAVSSPFSDASSFGVEKGTERKERRAWTHSDDVVLISAWLNTSKDPIVGNEQCSGAFWQRIADLYAASPNIARGEERHKNQCKHHWQKINDQVSKFSGAYEAATREKTSGQNEVDVIKHAHAIFLNNHKKKFTLEHAWRELRYDQKWCSIEGGNKRKKFGDGSHSASSSVDVDDDRMKRPPGVKAAKAAARGKKKQMAEGKEVSDFQTMWELKKEDLVRKERVVKLRLLDKLYGKKEPLDDEEREMKKKLMLGL